MRVLTAETSILQSVTLPLTYDLRPSHTHTLNTATSLQGQTFVSSPSQIA